MSADGKSPEWSDAFLLKNYGGRFPLVPVRGEGVWLWDAEGKKYLDFGMGIAVCSLGHCHPGMTKAIQEQASQLVHCSNLYRIPGQGELAQMLTEQVVGHPGRCFFCNSGAEANETLLKLARKYGQATPKVNDEHRYEVITFTASFHGRTLGTMSATAQEKIHGGFGPLLNGFRYLPLNDLAALDDPETGIRPETVAFLLEPVQGEGGINMASPEFLARLSELCSERDLLLMFDEIQCGVGRIGHLAAWKAIAGEDTDLVPDAVSWAKGIGGGFPMGSVWIGERPVPGGEQKLHEMLPAGTHGTTFGGSPLASAVGLAVVGEIIEQDLAANSLAREAQIRSAIGSWDLPMILRLRGKGLMLGFVLDPDWFSDRSLLAEGQPASLFMVLQLMEAGLLVVPAGTDVLRWLPPLNVTADEVETALGIFHDTFLKLTGE